jgi:hypothetical protein
VSDVERLEAELALAKLEEKWVKAKAEGKADEMRGELRDARAEFRAKYRPVVAVSPAAVGAKASVKGTS